jgi:CO/xanthine dehydrogenase Mo-binding subunit
MGALLANGVYDATGARLFQLPMTPERVKAALQKV